MAVYRVNVAKTIQQVFHVEANNIDELYLELEEIIKKGEEKDFLIEEEVEESIIEHFEYIEGEEFFTCYRCGTELNHSGDDSIYAGTGDFFCEKCDTWSYAD